MRRFANDQVAVLAQAADHSTASAYNPNRTALPYNTVLCLPPIKTYVINHFF